MHNRVLLLYVSHVLICLCAIQGNSKPYFQEEAVILSVHLSVSLPGLN